MNTNEGFLIVLTAPDSPHRLRNKRYQGIDRVPSYRLRDQEPIEEEVEAMDHYILSDIRNELGMIDSYQAALELLAKFAKSPRKFEIIKCRCVPGNKLKESEEITIDQSRTLIGFDAAVMSGDYWSIVGDFPNDKRFDSDFAKLNNYGVFCSANDALDYLSKYRSLGLPDYDDPFVIVEVHLT